MVSMTSVEIHQREESDPLLRDADQNEATRARNKCKITAVAVVCLAAVVVTATLGVSLYSRTHQDAPLGEELVLSIHAQQICPGEPFEALTQAEIEALIVPKDTLKPDLVELLSNEEQDWLLREQVPQHPGNLIVKHRRKEVRTLTEAEWMTYARGVRKMKETFPTSGARSEYDILVAAHSPGISPYAHFGPTVLPWHRVYLDKLESVLTVHEPNVSLPYWDTVLDEPLPTPKHSVLWTDRLFGTDEGDVTSGVFARHTNPAGYCTEVFGEYLQRGVAPKMNRLLRLLSNPIIEYSVLNYTSFSDLTKPVTLDPAADASSMIETYHASGHGFFGGDLANVPCAPVDPVFWLWHASLDAIWEEFRTESQTTNRQTEYPVLPNIAAGYHPYAPMIPFSSFPNIWGLSDQFTTYRYEYDPRPTKYSCSTDDDCGSPQDFLWCDDCGRCVSKVREGGDCTGLTARACYCAENRLLSTSACMNNKCACQ